MTIISKSEVSIVPDDSDEALGPFACNRICVPSKTQKCLDKTLPVVHETNQRFAELRRYLDHFKLRGTSHHLS